MEGIPGLSPGLPGLKEIAKLPAIVYCPICKERLRFVPISPQQMAIARAHGLEASAQVRCGCGLQGTLHLRRDHTQGYPFYSMSFWILPGAAEKAGTLSKSELAGWKKRNVIQPKEVKKF